MGVGKGSWGGGGSGRLQSGKRKVKSPSTLPRLLLVINRTMFCAL